MYIKRVNKGFSYERLEKLWNLERFTLDPKRWNPLQTCSCIRRFSRFHEWYACLWVPCNSGRGEMGWCWLLWSSEYVQRNESNDWCWLLEVSARVCLNQNLAAGIARRFFYSLPCRYDRINRFSLAAQGHQDSRQKTQLPLMNDFETLGQLDAAEVFSQEDFDPTPEDLGLCPCCCDVELYMAEAWCTYPPTYMSNCSIQRQPFATIFSHVTQHKSPLLDRRPTPVPSRQFPLLPASAWLCDKV